jgi:hypothetical protein
MGIRRTGEDFPMEVTLGGDGEAGSIAVRDITARKSSEVGFKRATDAIRRRLERELQESRVKVGYAATGEYSMPGADLALLVPPGTDWFGAFHDGGNGVTLFAGDHVAQGGSTAALLSTVFTGGQSVRPEEAQGLLLGDARYPPERQLHNLADVLNRIVAREGRGEVLLAMTLVHVDLGTGNAVALNAGRQSPTLLRSGRSVRDLGSGGAPLGYALDTDVAVSSFALGAGDVLVMTGAGLIDAYSPDGSVLRIADLKKRILARNTAHALLTEIATLSRVVWKAAHDQHPILVLRYRAAPSGSTTPVPPRPR